MGDVMKIICIGHAAWDITIPVSSFPIENTKNRYNNVVECGGGPAANASYLLGKWGLNPYFVGTVGNDIYGDNIIDSLNRVSVNTEFIEIINEPTTRSLIIANKENGSRTIITYQNGDIKRNKSFELPFEPDIILFDGQEDVITKDFLNKYPKAISIMDAGKITASNIELAKMAKYVICSANFAEQLANKKFNFKDYESLEYIYKEVQKHISGTLVVTLGEHGTLYEKNSSIINMPAIKVNVLDSTGAGDIFHGAFVYGLSKGLTLEQNIKLSTVAAGLSTKHIGVQNSIVSLEEVKEKLYEVE